jgi:ribosomal-protein-alanine N-acetyltransferase
MNHFVRIGWKDLSLYAEQIIEIENSSFPSPWSINAFKEEIKKPVSHLWAVVEDEAPRSLRRGLKRNSAEATRLRSLSYGAVRHATHPCGKTSASLPVMNSSPNGSVESPQGILAKANKKILGYICFWMFDTEIQIINLAVRPENRRQKLGQSMLKRMIEAGSSNGLRSIWLEVRPSNVPARNLYTKFGFHEAGRRKRYYSDTNEDAIIMMLKLSPQERDKQNLGPFSKN